MEAFRETIRLNPNHVRAYSQMGSALRSLGRDVEAAAASEQVTRLLGA